MHLAANRRQQLISIVDLDDALASLAAVGLGDQGVVQVLGGQGGLDLVDGAIRLHQDRRRQPLAVHVAQHVGLRCPTAAPVVVDDGIAGAVKKQRSRFEREPCDVGHGGKVKQQVG